MGGPLFLPPRRRGGRAGRVPLKVGLNKEKIFSSLDGRLPIIYNTGVSYMKAVSLIIQVVSGIWFIPSFFIVLVHVLKNIIGAFIP